ncbi:MAG: UvrD-helicase domain-containing protein [Thermodesulfobacteriota bacterium]
MSRPFDPMTLPLAGVQLIEASAGTGKTYSITSLYLRLLLSRRLGVEQILVVTFTEAATAELHERVRSRLQAAIEAFEQNDPGEDAFLAGLLRTSRNQEADLALLRRALSGIDEAAITTIHGFCHRMLQRGAFESGMPFDLELVSQVAPLAREVVQDFLATLGHEEEYRLVALLHESVTEADLLALASEAVRHREFPLTVPVAGLDCGQLRAQALAAYGASRALWCRESGAIREDCEGAGLTKECRRRLEEGLWDRLALYLEDEEPRSFIPPAGAELLTPQAFLGQGRKKACTATAVRKNEIPHHSFFAEWQRYVQAVDALRAGFLAAALRRLAEWARVELPRRLYREQAQSFDDLLHGLDRALAGPGGPALAALVRASYPAALIDEFQDTDPVQYRIFRALYGEGRDTALFLIGDPKQAIYSFRGADIFAYLKAAGDAGESHTMTTNWRADAAMVAAVNRLFARSASPFLDARIHFAPVAGARHERRWQGRGEWQAPLQFLALPADYPAGRGGRVSATTLNDLVPEVVAADIVRLLASDTRIDGRPVRPADVAVLVRTNGQAGEMQQALHRCGVAAVLQSRASVFMSHEARELLLLLRAVAEPGDPLRFRSALVTDYLGLTAADLLDLDGSEEELRLWLERFGRWHRLWHDHGLIRFLGRFREEAGVAARLVRYPDGLRRLTNLRHLGELLHARELERRCRPLALCGWLAEQCRGEGGGEEAELRLESDADAVQLVTIHRSKGLEYPVVYCPYLWKGLGDRRLPPKFFTYHAPEADWAGHLALFPTEEQRRLHEREEFAEGVRLLYVAITRARHCCLIPWAGASSYPSSALAYLLHAAGPPPDDLAEWCSRLDAFSHAELLEQLTRRVEEEEGWSLRVVAPDARVTLPIRPAAEPATLTCPQPAAGRETFWRIGSFSGLTAAAPADRPEADHDYDEALADLSPDTEALAAEIPLALFPRGATAGNFFHRLLELASFQATADELLPLVAEQLDAFGFAAAQWREPLSRALHRMLTTPLAGRHALTLADLPAAQRLHELPFFVPAGSDKGLAAVTSRELARAMDVEAASPLASYLARLGRLDFQPLAGYLKGFVDLVFAHEGRWYIVDYKSNHLGDRYADYDQAALGRAMAEHHYYLQYHLYAVAVDRYLRLRLAGYRYDEHFGGIFYLFLKGMHPGLPGNGVFFDRPPAARIAALAGLFAGEAR